MAEPERKWTVLLIGGSSCTGKTTVAAELGGRFGVPWAQVDDFRLALQRSTPPEEFRDLHFFVNEPDFLRHPPEELAAALGRVAVFMSHALEVVVESRIATQKPLILEGDGLLPSLATIGNNAAGPSSAPRVRAVFLCEPDEVVLLNNAIERGRGADLPKERRAVVARMAGLHGQWLCKEARQQNLPVLKARPYATLADRIEAAISGP